MPPKVTIDNLGPRASETYAKAQKGYESLLAQESSAVSLAEIQNVTPIPLELEALLGPSTKEPLASFFPPPNYSLKKSLFSHLIVPSLGSLKEQRAKIETLIEKSAVLKNPKAKRENELLKKLASNFWDPFLKREEDLQRVDSETKRFQKG